MLTSGLLELLFSEHLTNSRNQHWYTPFVFAVLRMCVCQIVLFQLNRNQGVERRNNRKKQMGDRHCWCRPEHDNPTNVERVTNDAIQNRLFEYRWFVFPAKRVEQSLAQSEKVKVSDL